MLRTADNSLCLPCSALFSHHSLLFFTEEFHQQSTSSSLPGAPSLLPLHPAFPSMLNYSTLYILLATNLLRPDALKCDFKGVPRPR